MEGAIATPLTSPYVRSSTSYYQGYIDIERVKHNSTMGGTQRRNKNKQNVVRGSITGEIS